MRQVSTSKLEFLSNKMQKVDKQISSHKNSFFYSNVFVRFFNIIFHFTSKNNVFTCPKTKTRHSSQVKRM